MPVPFPRYWLLHNGSRLPNLGFGTFQSSGDKLKNALDCALCIGYRHIDTARSYGCEKDIGEVLRDRTHQGLINRKDLFITTKVPSVYLGEKDVRYSLDKSLEDLQMTYVDMLLIHNPFGLRNHGDNNLKPRNEEGDLDLFHHDLTKTWKAMEDLVKNRKVRSIGLSNFTSRQINKIWYHAQIKPSNLQLECHAYNQQHELIQYCEAREILVTGYAPLGCPQLPDRQKHGRQLPRLLDDPVITKIAQSIKRTNAQVLLRFLQQLNVAPLPKSEDPKRVEENFHTYDFVLERSQMQEVFKLNQNIKFFDFDYMKDHPEYYKDEAF